MDITKPNKNVFETLDYTEAALLHAHGIPVKAYPFVTSQTDRRVEIGFVTTETPEVLRVIAEFHADSPFPLKTFLKAASEIKNTMMGLVRSITYNSPHRTVDHSKKDAIS